MITLVVLVLLFAGCSAMMSGPKSKPKPAIPDKYGAQSICEKATRQQLKSPSSAKFTDVIAVGAGASWTVRGSSQMRV